MSAQRSADLRIADHVVRPYWEPRFILVYPANLDACGKRVDSQETERCPTGPWLAHVAEARPIIDCGWQKICISSSSRRQACQETRWRIDREAVVDHLAPGTEGTLEVPTPAKA